MNLVAAGGRKLSAEIKIWYFSVRPGIYQTIGPFPILPPSMNCIDASVRKLLTPHLHLRRLINIHKRGYSFITENFRI